MQRLACDVRDQAQVDAAVKQTLDWHGRIDVLMYIAGIPAPHRFWNSTWPPGTIRLTSICGEHS